jgi:hypothetical protein
MVFQQMTRENAACFKALSLSNVQRKPSSPVVQNHICNGIDQMVFE